MINTGFCVHCGLCLPSCPTYQVSGIESESPRGRVYLLEEIRARVEQGQRDLDPQAVRYLDDCLDCRACEEVCPAHVPVGHYVEEFRAEHRDQLDRANQQVANWLTRFFGSEAGLKIFQTMSRWSKRPAGRVMTALGTRVPGLVPPAALSLAAGLPDTIAMHLSRERIPRASRANSGAPVVMQFIGCVMDSVYADTNRKTYEVLTAVGYDVRVPPSQRCCGALHVHAGHPETAREWAKINIAAFEQSGADAMAINAAGCGAALKEYPALLQQETGQWVERAERFAEAVHDVSRIISEGDFPTLPARGVTVTMHDACHLAHAQGIRQEPRHLLQKAGYHLIEMEEPDRCCGSAGVYNLTHPAMAQALQDKKVADIPDEAEVVVTGNPGCQMQIQAGLRKHGRPTPVRHTVDLIWQALSDAHHIPEKAEVRGGVKLES